MSAATAAESSFYVAGGNLNPNARSYVVRPADDELFESIRDGHYSYVLTSRQMGKSSLMHRTAVRLQEAGILRVLLDLTAIGANLTAEQWYFGLLAELGKQLSISAEIEQYWTDNQQHGPLYRFIHALSDVALKLKQQPIAIFIDEIDFIRGLKNFSTDEFFAGIRQCYNSRATLPEMQRLTFCLLGVATPADLIRDPNTTPFNIGRQIELTDFTVNEAEPLVPNLDKDPRVARQKLRRIFDWTGGHPYLTQKLCLALTQRGMGGVGDVDDVCHELFLASGMRRSEDNLIFVQSTLRNVPDDPAAILYAYRRVLEGKPVPSDPADPIAALLRLSGVVRAAAGRLKVRNRIYSLVFDRQWIVENMPDAELRRARLAYRAGIIRAAAVFGAILLVMGGLLWEAVHQTNFARDGLYYSDTALAQENLSNSDIAGLSGLLDKHTHDPRRSFDWDWLWTSAHSATTLHDGSDVYAVAFAPVGRMLATGDLNGKVDLWSTPDEPSAYPRLLHSFGSPVCHIVFSKDGTELAVLATDNIMATVAILSVETGRVLASWTTTAYIDGLAFSPSGMQVAVAGDFGVHVYSRIPGKTIIFNLGKGLLSSSVAFDPGGRWIIAGYTAEPSTHPTPPNNGVFIGNLENGAIRKISERDDVNNVTLSPDGNQFATSTETGNVFVRDVGSGALDGVPLLSGGPIESMVFSHDGKKLATGGRDQAVHLWDLRSDTLMQTLVGHTGTVTSVSFTPNDKTVAAGSYDKSTMLWNLGEPESSAPLSPPAPMPRSYVLSSNGKWIADADTDGIVWIWNAERGVDIYKYQLPAKPGINTINLLFEANNDYLMVGRPGMPLGVYSVANWKPAPGEPGYGLPIERPMAISSDGSMLADGANTGVDVWNLRDRSRLFTVQGNPNQVAAAAFSPDGRRIAIGEQQIIFLFDTRSGHQTLFSLPSKDDPESLTFTPDGKEVVSGGEYGTVGCWYMSSNFMRQTITLPSENNRICTLAFSPEGDTLEAVTDSNNVHMWHLLPTPRL